MWPSSSPKACQCVGTAKKKACRASAGEILAHFDDDDLYASGYLTWMKQRLDKTLDKDGGSAGRILRPHTLRTQARSEKEKKEREEKEKQPPLHKESRSGVADVADRAAIRQLSDRRLIPVAITLREWPGT